MIPSDVRTVRARAKVNVFLRVLGRRPDGYHELETLIVPISLADLLSIHAAGGGGDFRTLALSIDVRGDPGLVAGVPADESNLVLRAASALASAAGVTGFADMELDKRIPVAGGLGGGSADAAAVILALNDLWGLRLSEASLEEVAASVGSDVPALLAPGAALARGRGERIERIEVPSYQWAILTFPFGVSTAEAFRWWDDDGQAAGPEPSNVVDAARSGDPAVLGPLLFNDLERPVLLRYPEIRDAKERMLEIGAAGAVMCGSGPTLAALMPFGKRMDIDGVMHVSSD